MREALPDGFASSASWQSRSPSCALLRACTQWAPIQVAIRGRLAILSAKIAPTEGAASSSDSLMPRKSLSRGSLRWSSHAVARAKFTQHCEPRITSIAADTGLASFGATLLEAKGWGRKEPSLCGCQGGLAVSIPLASSERHLFNRLPGVFWRLAANRI